MDDGREEDKRPRSQVGGSGLSPVERLRRRMYSMPEYMKMIKQWFTEDYNARHVHKGTMWEATYRDRTSPYPESDFSDPYLSVKSPKPLNYSAFACYVCTPFLHDG